MNEFFTVVICATAKDLQAAQPLCLQWMQTQKGRPQVASDMLPTPLSPTGTSPATHWVCCMQLTQAQAEHMAAFIADREVPVRMTIVAPQADGTQFKLVNFERWLKDHALREVA
jgi:hypothetical protein